MTDIALRVEHLSKKYTIHHESPERYRALRDVLSDKVTSFRNILKRSTSTPTKETFFALHDVNFEVQQGEAIGIIGRNGAGKSTLLKLLSRIIEPSSGRISLKGRVASLLEVGTGFHPELTGRENIFLNGTILGMKRSEIRQKFDEIVAFAGIEQFLDTPIKRYSSGMYMRLAFSVAAHLESEILIVDEVLAVGDAEFQKKCLGKMDDVAKQQGRTVLFVSHNMGAIQQLCQRGLLLDRGKSSAIQPMKHCIQEYLKTLSVTQNFYQSSNSKRIRFECVRMIDIQLNTITNYLSDQPIYIEITLYVETPSLNYLDIDISLVHHTSGQRIFTISKAINTLIKSTQHLHTLLLELPGNFLLPNTYSWIMALHQPNTIAYDVINNICNFTIEDAGSELSKYTDSDVGYVVVPDYKFSSIKPKKSFTD